MRLLVSLVASLAIASSAGAQSDFVFAYFKGNGDGLHLAHSTDGLTWRAVRGDSVLFRPTVGTEKLLRDPSVARAADGTYHMVWTAGWNERGFGHATSRDLVTWTNEQYVPIMAQEPTARNVWAPELLRDEPNDRWIVVWATTIPGRFPTSDSSGVQRYNHRLYWSATRDFVSWTPARVFYEPGFSVIDAQIVRHGGRYAMILKNETDRPVAEKNLRVAWADSAAGPYGPPSAPITGDFWAEGPALLRVGERWYLYFDRYREHRYGALASMDLRTWTDVSDRLVLPAGIRHGTALAVPAADARRLLGR
jgi:hypothetical protein